MKKNYDYKKAFNILVEENNSGRIKKVKKKLEKAYSNPKEAVKFIGKGVVRGAKVTGKVGLVGIGLPNLYVFKRGWRFTKSIFNLMGNTIEKGINGDGSWSDVKNQFKETWKILIPEKKKKDD